MRAFLCLSDQPEPHRCSWAWCVIWWRHRGMIREHVCPSIVQQDGIKAGLLGLLRRQGGSALCCSLGCCFSLLLRPSVSTVCVWALYSKILSHLTHLDALSWSSSTRTHSHYITPFFYVMTAAALRLNLPSLIFLPHTLTVLPRSKINATRLLKPESRRINQNIKH